MESPLLDSSSPFILIGKNSRDVVGSAERTVKEFCDLSFPRFRQQIEEISATILRILNNTKTLKNETCATFFGKL